jgi:hypothetical protein
MFYMANAMHAERHEQKETPTLAVNDLSDRVLALCLHFDLWLVQKLEALPRLMD